MKRLIYILLMALLAMATNAQSVKELQKQRDKALKQLETTNKLLGETKQNEKATVNKLNLLGKDIAERRRLIGNLNNEITALDQQMDTLTARRADLQTQLESLKDDYARLVRQTHYQDMQQSPLLFVLAAENFQQMVRRMRYLREFAAYRKQQVARIETVQQEIDLQNQLLQESKADKQDALQVRQREQDKLRRDEKKQQSMLNELKKKEKDLAAQAKKQQKKADELNRKIEDQIRKEMAKSKEKPTTKEQSLVSGGFEKNKGRLPWPVDNGVIISSFGVHPHPTLELVTVNNKGISIQSKAGSMARAVYEGEVTSVFQTGGTWAIIIAHGSYRTIYSGLSSVSVKAGDKVKTKQNIGKIYTDPEDDNATVLQFQVRKDTEPLNPSLWITH